jgi:prepilin-type N-terminal cleavage/methylation domain-containing protein
MSHPSSANRGFTLSELLVTVAIVALLVGVLMPALSAAKGMAKSSRCRSNLRMLGLAMHGYAEDNRGFLPYHAEGDWSLSPNPLTGTAALYWWPERINPYVDESYRATNYQGNNAFHCPHAETEVQPKWLYTNRFSFHFGMNAAVQGKWWQKWTGSPIVYSYWERPLVHRTRVQTRTVILADAKAQLYATTKSYYFYDEVNTGINPWMPWPVDGAGAIGVVNASTTVDRAIKGHRGSVSRWFYDGRITALSGTWRPSEENPLWTNAP